MEDHIEKIINLAGNKNRYQYFIGILTFFFWLNINFFSVTIPYLEITPLISYYDKENGKTIVELLSYDTCNDKELNYEIVKTYNNSWVIEQNLECEKFKTGLIGSFSFTGSTLGALLYPVLSKVISQKKIILIGISLMIIFMSLCIFINKYAFYYIILIFSNIGCNLSCYSSLTLTQEVSVTSLRGFFGSFINFGFSLGGIIYSILFMNIHNWKVIFLICVIIIFILGLICIFFVVDAPRSVLRKNFDKFIELVRKISVFNGKNEEFEMKIQEEEYKKTLNKIKYELSNHHFDDEEIEKHDKEIQSEKLNLNDNKNKNNDSLLKNNINTLSSCDKFEIETEPKNKEIERIKEIIIKTENNITENNLKENSNSSNQNEKNKNSENKRKKKKISSIALIKYPSIRYKFLSMCLIWFIAQGIYSGLNIGIKSLPGNVYVNGIISYSSDIISYIVTPILMEIQYFGRKKTGLFSFLFSTIFLIFLFIFINHDILSIILYFIIHFFIAIPYSLFYTYCLEIYPTPIRAIGFGLNATLGNIGGIVVPIVIELLPRRIIYLIFAILSGICSFLFLFLEETYGKHLPETIKEIEEENNKNNNCENEE